MEDGLIDHWKLVTLKGISNELAAKRSDGEQQITMAPHKQTPTHMAHSYSCLTIVGRNHSGTKYIYATITETPTK